MSSVATFTGSPRYELRRVLGSGATGVVYEAFDSDLGHTVAIKTLHHLDPTSLMRLKREFRELADVAHPNLVALHGLSSIAGQWFLAMELIDGQNFLLAVRGADLVAHDTNTSDATYSMTTDVVPLDASAATVAPLNEAEGALAPDLPLLREAFRQLAEAVHALHQANLLHRDLKPSNVLVTTSGRVVVLDFGLVTDADAAAAPTVAGSVSYMSPEQAAGRTIGPASDWYAVGTMLFEALTGRRPFEGPVSRVLVEKQATEAPRPSDLCEGVPPDLDALCAALLSRDPARRPAGAAILAAFGGETAERARRSRLVGREAALGALRGAWAGVQSAGRPALARVRGRSGFGKSMLVEAFLAEVEGAARVLTGRCYERESVPYKALDALADGLVEDLGNLPEPTAGGDVLVQLFPVFRRAPAFAFLQPSDIPDPNERRERGFAALAGVVLSLAPVVVFVDDVHWGDADSASLFVRLLLSPAPLLLVLAWRDDEEDTPFLRALDALLHDASVPITRVDLGELAPADATELARELLPHELGVAAADVAAAGNGNPMFVHELARRRAAAGEMGTVVDLDEAIRWRVGRLPERPRRLLELVAVSGRPTPLRLLQSAAGVPDAVADVAMLRVGRFVRTTGELVAPFHDRVREAVVSGLGSEAAAAHRALADALAATPEPDPEVLATHLLGAGDPERARPLLVAAAERAGAASAFEHAARLYRLALEAGGTGRQTLRRLGEALAFAGRGAEAAEAWLAASEGAERSEAVTLRRQAGEQLLAAGHVDRGLAELGRALAEVGLSMPPTGDWALLELLPRMFWLWLRGTKFTPRSPPDADAALQIDLCWSGVNGLAYIDRYRSATFQARQLTYALAAGDSFRVARSLCVEGAFAALGGGKGGVRKSEALLSQARQLLLYIDDPELHALELYCRAIAMHFVGRQKDGLALALEAEEVYRRSCSHVAWQVVRTLIVQGWMAMWTGDFRLVDDVVARVLREARRTGNRYAHAAILTDDGWMAWLVHDDPDGYDRALDELGDFPEMSLQEFGKALGRVYSHLYRGEAEAASRAVEEANRRFRRTMLNLMQISRVMTDILRLRARLQLAEKGAPLAEAKAVLAGLAKEDATYAAGLAALFQARVDEIEGDVASALGQYRAAVAVFEAHGWAPYVQAALWRIGALAGGPDGARMQAEAEAWFRSQGVERPDRLVAFFVGAVPPGKSQVTPTS